MRAATASRPNAVAMFIWTTALLAAGTTPLPAYDVVQVTDDEYLNYMPSLVQCQDGSLMLAYERLDSNYENGDLMLTVSGTGDIWTNPCPIVATSGNERHPSLVQLRDGTYQIYYLSDETGGYRIHMADSPDGAAWTRRGVVDLGWGAENLVNPTVCTEADGSLTMSYDVLSNGGYVAHSEDGLTWDDARTNVSTGSLNRITRHSDGTYVLSYQRKTGAAYYQIDIFTKTSPDRVSWSAENRVTYTQNSHDSFPVELADGQYALYYATSTGGNPYDLYSRVAPDGSAWSSEQSWLPYAGWDTEPHPVRLSSGVMALAWPRGTTQTNMQVRFALLDPPTSVDQGGAPTQTDPAEDTQNVPLLRCRPNPFSGTASLSLSRVPREPARATIFDPRGRIVRRLVIPAGLDGVTWDGRDSAGRVLPSGVYFLRLDRDPRAGAARLVLLR